MRTEVLRLVLGLAALAIVLYGAATVLDPFARSIVWAAVLGLATWPIYRRLRARLPGVLEFSVPRGMARYAAMIARGANARLTVPPKVQPSFGRCCSCGTISTNTSPRSSRRRR